MTVHEKGTAKSNEKNIVHEKGTSKSNDKTHYMKRYT